MVNYQKLYRQPCLNQGPWFEAQVPGFTDQDPVAADHGPGLLEPFVTQIWMSVRGQVSLRVTGQANEHG